MYAVPGARRSEPEHLTGMAGYRWWGPLCPRTQCQPAERGQRGCGDNAAADDESWSLERALHFMLFRRGQKPSMLSPPQQHTLLLFVTSGGQPGGQETADHLL
jgi:hypothetical protein